MSVIVSFINKTMEWFKFYKKDYLTDTKIIGIDPLLRLLWVTLLCLCDDNGQIKYLKEIDLIRMAGCDDDMMNDISDLDRTKGCLEFFQERGMVSLQTVTNTVTERNDNVTYHVTVTNYLRRQGTNLSNSERQKRYRDSQKIASNNGNKMSNVRNVTQRNDSNAREDKRRIDKKRIDLEKEIVKKKNHTLLEEVLDVDVDEIARKYSVPSHFVWSKLDDMKNWHDKNPAKNKYVNYKAALTEWVKRDAMSIQKEAHGQSKIAYINTDSGESENPVQDQTNQRNGRDSGLVGEEQYPQSTGGGGTLHSGQGIYVDGELDPEHRAAIRGG